MLLQRNDAPRGVNSQRTVNRKLPEQDRRRRKLSPMGGAHPGRFSYKDDSGSPDQVDWTLSF